MNYEALESEIEVNRNPAVEEFARKDPRPNNCYSQAVEHFQLATVPVKEAWAAVNEAQAKYPPEDPRFIIILNYAVMLEEAAIHGLKIMLSQCEFIPFLPTTDEHGHVVSALTHAVNWLVYQYIRN